jgi:hypothetical protein
MLSFIVCSLFLGFRKEHNLPPPYELACHVAGELVELLTCRMNPLLSFETLKESGYLTQCQFSFG